MTCFWEEALFFQPISLHPWCSWPAFSSVDWLCPQSTVDRETVGSESILQDSGSMYMHSGLSKIKIWYLYSSHIHAMWIYEFLAWSLIAQAALLFLWEALLGAWRLLQSCSAMSEKLSGQILEFMASYTLSEDMVEVKIISRQVQICSGYTL